MFLRYGLGGLVLAGAVLAPVWAAETTIPNSALIPSTTLYTSNLGSIVVTTGGGNAANVGDPSGRNDDGYSGPINLGFTLNFFGSSYTQFWINNNGNISFGNGIAAYTPNGPTGATQPIISPFFADVDTRGSGSGVVYLSQLPNEDIITQNGFVYTTMQWEVGDPSGGVGGFCPSGTAGSSCFPAAVGFGDGQGNGEVLAGSLQPGISGIVNDEHIWFDVTSSGVPVTPGSSVPEPSTYGLLATGILGVFGLIRRRQKHS